MSDIKTVKTVSSGGVVVRDGEKGHEVVLVLSNPKRYWQIPKGMVDEGESLEAAALREVREETGVVAEVVAPVDTIDYWFQKKNKDGSRTRFHKIVHFYLMQYVSGELVTDWENLDAQWVQVDEAIERLSFKNAKEVMAKAKVLLEKPPKPAVSEKTDSKSLRIASWNVNGIRAVAKKGFGEWLGRERPHILCVQETKCAVEQVPVGVREVEGYWSYFAEAERGGYAGVALYARSEPQEVQVGLGIEEFDREGRTIVAEFKEFVVLNGYFPNGGGDLERVAYKMAYKAAFLAACVKWREKTGKPVVFCGDLNTAHRPIDVARPKTKKNKSGFLEEERNWIDEVLEAGFIDSFREVYPERGEIFSCWPYSRNSRLRNIGWRLDYIFVDEVWRERIVSAEVETAVYGSDHCPVTLELSWE